MSNVEGILKEGLKLSFSGTFGPGVYLIYITKTASNYGQCYVDDIEVFKDMSYLIVNKFKVLSNLQRKYFIEEQGKVTKESKVSFARRI